MALDVVQRAFGLTDFERDILLCCAGMELTGAFAAECAAAQGDPRRGYPTFALALAALDEAHWSALTPQGPLRRWLLLAVQEAATLVASPLRIDEPILHFLAGLPFFDAHLQEIAREAPDPGELPASHAAVAARLQRAWGHPPGALPPPLVQLCGPDPRAREAVGARACAALGMQARVVQSGSIPAGRLEQSVLARRFERASALAGQVLLLECADGASPEELHAAATFAQHLRAPAMLGGREPLSIPEREPLRIDLGPLTAAERRLLWERALGPLAPPLQGQLDHVAEHFNLGVQGIRAATARLHALAQGGGEGLGEALWEAGRAQARPRLERLAQRLMPAATWDDLVLPEELRQTLRQIASSVRQRARVHGLWGFQAQGARGLGLSALFAGPSGTGKTLAAEVLARELRLDLYRVDLSQVVNKYIGETEKNLRRVFDAAEESGSVLLFDEADALFGKRSEVKDSHDRYANIEVSYLLQRMEAYRGLAILTSNMKHALDPAFLRRIRFIVQFPFPDAAQREELWRRTIPASTPTEDLDAARLARLGLSGGNIRTVALNAAFRAADLDQPVRMAHLAHAARIELAKLEKPVPEDELRRWT
jgi:AAA+ superfamily predicted ATPase